MKVSSINFLIFASLLLVVGCGGQGKTVNLNVTGSFSISAAGYTGGLIAYGEGPNGARFSTTSGDGSSTLTTTIEDGVWKIYVVGWEDTALPVEKFKGQKYCGMTSVTLGFSDTDVSIDVNPANCASPAFQAEAGIKEVLISSCGAFYDYVSSTDTYSALTSASQDTFCANLPDGQRLSQPAYRLSADNIQGSTISSGILSDCMLTGATPGNRVGLPTKRMPFTVHTYSSVKDCQSLPVSQAQTFHFPKGLESGDPASFDHHFSVTAVPNARLFVPSSSTRRGYSPFMNLLPRILCATGDCFTSPVTPLLVGITGNSMIDVSWQSHQSDERPLTLAKNVASSNFSSPSCDPAVISQLKSSENFSVSGCHIDDGNLKGTLHKNAFLCRDSADPQGMLDLYSKNGVVYSVYAHGTNDYKVIAFTDKGVETHEIELNSSTSQLYRSMTVDQNQNLYVLMHNGTEVKLIFVPFSSTSKSYLAPQVMSAPHLTAATHIDVTDLGTVVTASPGSSNQLAAFTLSDLSNPIFTTLPLTNPTVKRIQSSGNHLWVMTNVNPNTYVYDYLVSGTSLTFGAQRDTYSIASLENFHIAPTATGRVLVYIDSASNPLKAMNLDAANNLTMNTMSASSIPAGLNIIYLDDNIYTLTGSPGAKIFTAHKRTASSIVQVPSTSYCQAKLTPIIAGNPYSINVTSRREEFLKPVFEDSFRFFGIRTVPSPEAPYYFRSLQTEDHDDLGRADGVLHRASGMMGPNGIGGIISSIYPNRTCGEIENLVAASGGLQRKFLITDPATQQTRTYDLEIKNSTAPVSSFLCSTTGCTTTFDLVISIKRESEEATKLKISCAEKIGSIETADEDGSEIRHELTVWNTQILAKSRYENYEVEDQVENGVPRKRVTLTRLEKNALNKVDVRSLELNRDPSSIQGRITELALNPAGDKITSSSIDTGQVAPALFNPLNTTILNNGQTVGAIVQDVGFAPILIPNAIKCMQQGNTSTIAGNLTCATPPHPPFTSSLDGALDFDLQTLETYTNGSSPSIYDIFTLDP